MEIEGDSEVEHAFEQLEADIKLAIEISKAETGPVEQGLTKQEINQNDLEKDLLKEEMKINQIIMPESIRKILRKEPVSNTKVECSDCKTQICKIWDLGVDPNDGNFVYIRPKKLRKHSPWCEGTTGGNAGLLTCCF